MLTIEEIRNMSFRKGTLKNGYSVEDVNIFIEEVISTFEQLKKDKTNLVHKIDVLATRIEQYRSDEETVRNALLASQKVSDACIKEAKEKAAKIIREAEAKAQALLIEANKTTATQKDNYLQLQSDAVALRSELIELYKKHIKNIDELPTTVDLENSQKALDEKYPTEPIAEESNEISSQTVGENTEQTSEEDADVKVVESAEAKEPKFKQTSKFSHLKFGDNYDVSAD